MNPENADNVAPFPTPNELSPEERREQINIREIRLKKIQLEIETLAGEEEILKQEIASLKGEQDEPRTTI